MKAVVNKLLHEPVRGTNSVAALNNNYLFSANARNNKNLAYLSLKF